MFKYSVSGARRTFLAVALCCTAIPNAEAIDRRLLPADIEVLATINFRQAYEPADSFTYALQQAGCMIIQRAVVNKSLKLIRDETPGLGEAMDLLRQAGFEPARDIETIAVAKPESENISDRFVIVEGRFDQKRCQRAIRKAGAKVSVGRIPIGTLKADRTVSFAVVGGKSLIVAYSADAIKDALVRVKENRFVATKVADLLDTLNGKHTFAIVASAGQADRLFRFLNLRSENSKGMCGFVTLAGDVQFELRAVCADKEQAEKLRRMIAEGIPVVRRFAAEAAQRKERPTFLVDIAATLSVVRTGNHCAVTANASFVNMGRLLAWAIY